MFHDHLTLSPRLIVIVLGRKLKPESETAWVLARCAAAGCVAACGPASAPPAAVAASTHAARAAAASAPAASAAIFLRRGRCRFMPTRRRLAADLPVLGCRP